MLVVDNIEKLRSILKPWKNNNVEIGFVPTMGNLHDGHLSLINHAKQEANKVIASIYVNPLQFDRPDDLSRYPRTLQADLERLEKEGVDVVFTPSDKMIYPDGIEMSTKVDVPVISPYFMWSSQARTLCRCSDSCMQTVQYGYAGCCGIR